MVSLCDWQHDINTDRTKILSDESFVNKEKGSDFRREIASPDEFNTGRNPNDPAKRLFDPNKDNPNSAPNETDSEHPDGYTDSDLDSEILLQFETRPISHDQLVVEMKDIYAGLVMLEAKCIDVGEKQYIIAQEKSSFRLISLSHEQWQALILLHKSLLHEHHDFFLASQHPFASPALSRLAAKYSMPARMWRHGIHVFLKVLRHRLPESLEHMLAFIYIAYSIMALLYETVSIFEGTWVECLGDLSRYRMAIEDENLRDREV